MRPDRLDPDAVPSGKPATAPSANGRTSDAAVTKEE